VPAWESFELGYFYSRNACTSDPWDAVNPPHGQSLFAQRRRKLALKEVEKVILVRSYLHKDDVIEAGFREGADGLEVPLCGCTAAYLFGYRFGRDVFARRCKSFRVRLFRLHRPSRH